MKRASTIIIISFFVVLCAGIAWKLSREQSQYSLIKRSLTEQALSYFDDDLKALTQAQVKAQQEEITLMRAKTAEQQAEVNARIAFVPFKWQLKRYGTVAYLSAGCLSVLIVASAGAIVLVKRGSVFFASVNGSTFPVRYRDLTSIMPALMGTVQAQIQAALATNEEAAQARARTIMSDMATLFKAIGGRRGLGTNTIDISPTHEAPAIAPTMQIPTFRDILTNLSEGDPMVLGYDLHTGDPITGNFQQLYSSFIAGKSGTGKSSWLRALILQSLVVYPDIQFFVLDPHSEHPESLSASLPEIDRFVYLDATNPTRGIYRFNRLLQDRLETPQAQRAPAVFVVDELAYCSRQKYANTLQTMLERISNEGRKAGCYLLASSQDTRLRKSGDFRDMLASCYAFNLKSSQARYLLQDQDENAKHKQVRELNQKGVALLATTEDESRVIKVPYCAPSDVAFVESQFHPTRPPDVRQVQSKSSGGISEQGDETETKQEAQHVATIMQQSTKQETVAQSVAHPVAPHETQGRQRNAIFARVETFMAGHDNMSLSKFSDLAGVNKGTLSQMLKGERDLTNDMAQKLLRFFQSQDTEPDVLTMPGSSFVQ